MPDDLSWPDLAPAAAMDWHVVSVTEKRIECAAGCDGPVPHLSEYRAPDVNPSRKASAA